MVVLAGDQTMADRARLPNRRQSFRLSFEHEGISCVATYSLYSGRPGRLPLIPQQRRESRHPRIVGLCQQRTTVDDAYCRQLPS